MNPVSKRLKRLNRGRDKGESLIALLVGMVAGAIILGSIVTFWVGQSGSSATNVTHQKAQNTSLAVANRVSREIQIAQPIIFAGPSEIITQTTDAAKKVVRTRYALTTAGVVTQQSWRNAPTAYNYASPGWSAVTAVSVAKGVHTDVPLFKYFTTAGVEITTLPLTNETGGTKPIARVDINIASDAGSGAVALTTSAALRNRLAEGDITDLVAPQCPPLSLSTPAIGANPILTWGNISGATAYRVIRDGTQLQRIAVTDKRSSFTYTDTAVTGATGRPVTYQVTAETPAGTSSSCPPVVWSPAAGSPAILLASVLPLAQSNPDAWNTSALTEPSMNIGWDAVPAASGYIIMRRELNPTTEAPLATAAGRWVEGGRVGASTTSYTYSTPGYAREYEFYVTATSKSGNSPASAYLKLLSHPQAPTVVTPTPDEYGQNTFTWNSVATGTGYEVWRYPEGAAPSGSTAGFSTWTLDGVKIKSAMPTGVSTMGVPTRVATRTAAQTTYTDQVALGSRYTYFIQAINTGPRDETQSDLTRYSATPISAATVKPNTNPVLQFPPDPPTSAAAGSDVNPDGTNVVTWSASKSATSYTVTKLWQDGAAPLSTTNVGTATKLTETGVAKGTQYAYYASALNATGISPNAAGVTPPDFVNATQLPAQPTLTLPTAPTLDSNLYKFAWNAAADAGNPADAKFCNAATCTYHLQKVVNGVWVDDIAGYYIASSKTQNWGDSTDRRVTACNAGGCSVQSDLKTANSYPGPFTVTTKESGRNAWFTTSKRPLNQSIHDGAKLQFVWTASAGSATYSSTGPGAIASTTALGANRVDVSPGAPNTYSVTSYAANKLSRTTGSRTWWGKPDVPIAPRLNARCGIRASDGIKVWRAVLTGDFRPRYWDTSAQNTQPKMNNFYVGPNGVDAGGIGWKDIGFDYAGESVNVLGFDGNQIGYQLKNHLTLGAGQSGGGDSAEMRLTYGVDADQPGCGTTAWITMPGPYYTTDGTAPIRWDSY